MEGIIFILLTVFRLRSYIAKSFPTPVKMATSAGIGLFLSFIGLKNSGIIVASPETFVTLGNLANMKVLTASIGLITMAGLYARKVPGAILIGILSATIAGYFTGETNFYWCFNDEASSPN